MLAHAEASITQHRIRRCDHQAQTAPVISESNCESVSICHLLFVALAGVEGVRDPAIEWPSFKLQPVRIGRTILLLEDVLIKRPGLGDAAKGDETCRIFALFVSPCPFALSFNHYYTAPDIAPVSQ
jgi:hypothetical protein